MENTINIQITVDDEQLKNLLSNNINDLPKEKIQEILLESIKEFLTSDKGQELFYRKNFTSYYDATTPSDFLSELIDKADISKSISPIMNEAIDNFSKNYTEILRQCVLECVSSMFMSMMDRSKLNAAFDTVMRNTNQE